MALSSLSDRKLTDIRKLSGDPDVAIRHDLQAVAIGEARVGRRPEHAESESHLAITCTTWPGSSFPPASSTTPLGGIPVHRTRHGRSDGMDLRVLLVPAQDDFARL